MTYELDSALKSFADKISGFRNYGIDLAELDMFEGKIVSVKIKDGNWYVEVDDPRETFVPVRHLTEDAFKKMEGCWCMYLYHAGEIIGIKKAPEREPQWHKELEGGE